MPAIPGMIATASSPAARATALFTPDADPANRSGAASSTVAVSGETVSVIPAPNTIIAGSTSVSHDASGPTRSRSSSPHADTSGPMVIGSRGPMRPASAPTRAENRNMITVSGSSAVPAATGLKPATVCSCSTSTRNTTLSGP